MNSFVQQNQEQQHSRAVANTFSREASATRSSEPNQFSALQERANHRPQALQVAQMQQMLNQSQRVRAPMQIHSAALNNATLASSRPVAQMNGKDPWYKRLWSNYIYGPHYYNLSHQVLPYKPFEMTHEEASEQTYGIIKGHPAPLSMGRESTEEGGTMWIPPFGQIHTTADPSNQQVTNLTMPWKHLLYPGWVKRTAEGTNIRTEGGGHGVFPRANEWFSNIIWGSMAYRDRLKHDPEFKEKHYEDIIKQMNKHHE
ncbi:MAG: hypothetical protein WCB68_10025 [Pyrinomonadaceae bacterium]